MPPPFQHSNGGLTRYTTDDLITYLDDESTKELTLDQAIEKMRGPPNTGIKLKIMRNGQASPMEFSITRAIIRPPSKEVQK